jgi:shikimate kinase
MRLSLIGMSGTGKSHWARKFAEAGFEVIGCDDLIAERLNAQGLLTQRSLAEVGQWLGLPDEAGYQARADQYLAAEQAVMAEITARLAQSADPARCVIDTTGSVIYMPPEILNALRQTTRVIYLDIIPAVREAMLRRYLENPPPVIWHGQFDQKPGETRQQAFERCYPRLLAERERLYRKACHVVMPYHSHHAPDMTVDGFLVALG